MVYNSGREGGNGRRGKWTEKWRMTKGRKSSERQYVLFNYFGTVYEWYRY